MQQTSRKEGSESGKLTPQQAVTMSRFLEVEDLTSIKENMIELLKGWSESEICANLDNIGRSNVVHNFFVLYRLIDTL